MSDRQKEHNTEGGLDQIAHVYADAENFHVRYSIRELIAKALAYPAQDISMSLLKPLVQGRQEDESQTKTRVDTAELQHPIIVFADDDGYIFAIGDGTHRVERAAAEGKESLSAHVIPASDMDEFSE